MTVHAPVLVATDFSAPARPCRRPRRAPGARDRRGADADARAARRRAAGAAPVAGRRPRAWSSSCSDEARQQLRAAGRRAAGARGTWPRATVTASGAVLDEILPRGRGAWTPALLVLGARGAGFLRRLVLGSTSERLLRRTTRPLLVVRQTPHEPYRRVAGGAGLLALVGARRCAGAPRGAACAAAAVQRLPGAVRGEAALRRRRCRHHRALPAAGPRRCHRSACMRWRPPAACSPATGSPASSKATPRSASSSTSRRQDCDLVVLGKHGQSATEDLLLGSVTKHVLAEGSTDVLVSTMRAEPAAESGARPGVEPGAA
ncbi:MAG: universal stress protein [Comamonadaceae bacterium]|nr:universal stress protein [Comamonadaceae bacterium]